MGLGSIIDVGALAAKLFFCCQCPPYIAKDRKGGEEGEEKVNKDKLQQDLLVLQQQQEQWMRVKEMQQQTTSQSKDQCTQ